MPNLDYIKQMNGFWKKHREFQFTGNEFFLYGYLLKVCNELYWKNPFNESNAYVMAALSITEPTLVKLKKALKNAGLIDFVSGDGRRKSTIYTIIDLSKDEMKGLNNLNLNNENTSAFPLDNNKHKTQTQNKNILFDQFWDLYDKKNGKHPALKKWNTLTETEMLKILKIIPSYVKSTPNKKYRLNPLTYLNDRHWEDEIINSSDNLQTNEAPHFELRIPNKQKLPA
ncbi:hypothetical protein [Daejeonella sp. H1SJ63]|uniref:hypothetical protein n=1 Tax=Daejeonella sp. H1SJ63 TaxID=3034145 RepID=UPI0023ED370E|nr:hypothetical protein [Daejeonella sp. H1SJ63]